MPRSWAFPCRVPSPENTQLATLGVVKSHSRPQVSNDNPFSESQFKTLKYRPEFPGRFAAYEHGLTFCREFFPWYNHEHHHWGLGLMTPATVHTGRAIEILTARQATLSAAYLAHPQRFVHQEPRPQLLTITLDFKGQIAVE